jgi:hypothetical protein
MQNDNPPMFTHPVNKKRAVGLTPMNGLAPHFISPGTTILALLFLLFFLPFPALAFWGSDEEPQSALDLESGYDVNTVTTVTGRILSVQTGLERRNVQLEIDTDGERMMVVLGPQRYLAEQGMELKEGDEVRVRGSKAQGRDGIIYILAREVTETSKGAAITLRDEGGFPNWAGGGMERGTGAGGGRGFGSGGFGGGGRGGGHGGGRGGR